MFHRCNCSVILVIKFKYLTSSENDRVDAWTDARNKIRYPTEKIIVDGAPNDIFLKEVFRYEIRDWLETDAVLLD